MLFPFLPARTARARTPPGREDRMAQATRKSRAPFRDCGSRRRGFLPARVSSESFLLDSDQLADALARELEEVRELLVGEGRALRSPLNLDEPAFARQHE